MGGGKRIIQKEHYCKICGKKIKPLGIARHIKMHREKSKEKQTRLL